MARGDFDVVILGGGMGGYPAAIRASQLGLKVALVESDKLGGTCLHIGCIPTKVLLESSELYHRVSARGQEFGVNAEKVTYDYKGIATRRDAVVNQLYKGVQFLMKKNKIEIVQGNGRLRDRNTVEVGAQQLKAKNLIVATGSNVKALPGIEVDGPFIVSSDHATRSAVERHRARAGGRDDASQRLHQGRRVDAHVGRVHPRHRRRGRRLPAGPRRLA